MVLKINRIIRPIQRNGRLPMKCFTHVESSKASWHVRDALPNNFITAARLVNYLLATTNKPDNVSRDAKSEGLTIIRSFCNVRQIYRESIATGLALYVLQWRFRVTLERP